AFVVAGAGVPVAKHGNRSISSRCGSADVLEALGVDLDLGPAAVATAIRTVGIGFLFAPKLHPAMKHAIGPRREIGIRTIFNVLGPLTNPAGANVQVMGVFASELTEPLAAVLGRLGARRALVVCGEGNMDELTVTGATKVSEWRNGEVTTWSVVPEDVGLTRAERKAISGADDPVAAAEQVRAILGGEPGARREMTALNAGAALMAAGQTQDLASGVRLALATIDSGAALRCLDRLVAFCQEQRA
ncbi:MAG TPA: anthranilate phosphoribosyltransferase, partial [Desulfobacterales bacterium]|nr:anthranilate phosphoribosyltransferase [Desulfobacterales bacterium]